VADFVDSAAGRVWLAEVAIPGAAHSWRTGSGLIRSIGGTPTPDATAAEPSVEDAYLLMLGSDALSTQEVPA
jgi:ABC-2 type transport system ATP-binding protein